MILCRCIVLLQLCLVLLALLPPSSNCSCYCGCCDCCGCCGSGCFCCGGSRNRNNGAAATAAAIGSAMITNTAQQAAAVAPPINVADEKPYAALGPELFPDGSTGRRIEQQQQLLDAIERGGNGGGVFFPGGGRRRRRAPGVGRLDATVVKRSFGTMFPGMGGGGGGGTNQQNPFGNDPPGLGPGLLPDGSTGRRKSQHGGGGFNDFFNGMNFDGMHSPAQRRQKRCQKLSKRQCDEWRENQCVKNECARHQHKCDRCTRCPPSKLKIVEIDPNLLRNYTVARFLLGLVPKELVESKTKNSGAAFTRQSDTDRPSSDNWPTDNPSLSAEIDVLSLSAASSEDDQKQQRFRPLGSVTSAAEAQTDGKGPEDLIARRLFLIPPIGAISGRKRREMTPSGDDAASVGPSPPLQFYKPTVPNPENADERHGIDDYD
ncbi:hypothetical protein niasHS_002813 [Heterodera schachtii]|uniref:Uncharacterized protein n=1 Tax=Heterodera schachtii TaxID=97005 RepID=A0ABD2K2J0_HETSC